MGRAARHVEGRVILYADRNTRSMKEAIAEVDRRRNIQLAYNIENNITPLTINKPMRDKLINKEEKEELPGMRDTPSDFRKVRKNVVNGKREGKTVVALNKRTSVILEDLDPNSLTPQDKQKLLKQLNRAMNIAAKEWNFELAAQIRDVAATLE